jgi:hypothetical protein
VRNRDGQWEAESGAFLRTQRRLFAGAVLVRGLRLREAMTADKPNVPESIA